MIVLVQKQNSDITEKTTITSKKTWCTSTKELKITQLTNDDVIIGDRLGSGTFSNVYRVSLLQQQLKDTLLSSSQKFNGKNKKFVIKRLREETLQSKRQTKEGCYGLNKEVEVLSQLPYHDNIIKLYAVSMSDSSPRNKFLILDHLPQTLDERMKLHRKRNQTEPAFAFLEFLSPNSVLVNQQMRLKNIGIGLTEALDFLHTHRILFRDLKPANVGFDDEGNVKLFDFGLARYYSEQDESDRKITKFCGTVRYMAPEVAVRYTYTFSADVYSLAILLWEICTFEKPFSKAKSSDHIIRSISEKKLRPNLNRVASKEMRKLLKTAWDPSPDVRPSLSQLLQQLRSILPTIQPVSKGKFSPCA